MDLATLRESMQKLAPGSVPTSSHGTSGPAREVEGNALALTPVASGIAAFDKALLLGGLPAGRLTEIAGSASSGKTGLGLQLLAEQTKSERLVALVDGTGEFYPPAAAAMGLDLRRTLLIAPKSSRPRTRDRDPALPLARAAEIIARSRAFSMVLIDLPPGMRVQGMPARRLRVAAQATGTTLIVLSTHSGDVEGAVARVEASPCQELHSRGRKSQLRIVKGGQGVSPHIEVECPRHRFDAHPPCEIAQILHRALPGDELSPPTLTSEPFLERERFPTRSHGLGRTTRNHLSHEGLHDPAAWVAR